MNHLVSFHLFVQKKPDESQINQRNSECIYKSSLVLNLILDYDIDKDLLAYKHM